MYGVTPTLKLESDDGEVSRKYGSRLKLPACFCKCKELSKPAALRLIQNFRHKNVNSSQLHTIPKL